MGGGCGPLGIARGGAGSDHRGSGLPVAPESSEGRGAGAKESWRSMVRARYDCGAMGVWLLGAAAGRPVDARFRTAAPVASFVLDVDRDGAVPLWRWL